MKNESKERTEQRKAVKLVRSIMTLYLEKSGRYSKEEIIRRVNENIKRVNLRPRDNDYLGEASIDEPEITIYGVDNRAPTVDEMILNLAYYKPTILHEGEHKFFTHKDEEGNITGTGLLRLINRNRDFKKWLKESDAHADMKQIERFVPDAQELKKRKINPFVRESEIGRGINEGFTEWYRRNVLEDKDEATYEKITSVLDKLQEYIDGNGDDGISAIAEYGDSDYGYVFDTLNMSKPTGIAFVRILDVMYYLLEKKRVDRMDDIIRYFELEEANVLQPDFLSRYGERIRGLDIFRNLQEEYKKLPYRKESFKEFVARKNEEKSRALLRYQRLISAFLAKALDKKDKGQGTLELPDVSKLIEEVTVLSAQNMDDIAEGMKASFERHKSEVKEKGRKVKNKEKADKKEIGRKDTASSDEEKSKSGEKEAKPELVEEEMESEVGNTPAIAGEEIEPEEGNNPEADEEEIVPEVEPIPDMDEEVALETGINSGASEKVEIIPKQGESIKEDIVLATQGGAIDSIGTIAKSAIDMVREDVRFTVEDIKLDVKDVLEDIKYNVNDMVDDIKFGIKYRKIARATAREQKRYSDKSGKLAFVALAAALGISAMALTTCIIADLAQNMKDIQNTQITEPQENEKTKSPVLPIEIPEAPVQTPETETEASTFPFLNEDGTISLKAGSTIYRSSDKASGKTTLKYDYDNLIIDYIKLMQNTNQVVDTGDLSSLAEFIESLGEEDLSLMMRLAVEQNGEKVYIAWCDYAEMLENAKNIEEAEKTEDTER